jgi:hypothetical protein
MRERYIFWIILLFIAIGIIYALAGPKRAKTSHVEFSFERTPNRL